MRRAHSSSSNASSRKTRGALIYTLRVEDPQHQTGERKAYATICPQYVRSPLGMPLPAP